MLPDIITTIAEVRDRIGAARRAGRTVGFVPTMGALHAGHASLIRAARAENDFVVVSIFVNPTQFGPNEDLARYPRPLDADQQLCGALGADLIFAPSSEEMYAPGFCTWVTVEGLADELCGGSRPGHFRGVATVVLKLFNIVQADVAYFGQKDYQQARIIVQAARDLNVPTDVRVLPTVREPDGLAMSSRNQYLDPVQRRHATVLYRALEETKRLVRGGEGDVKRLEEALAAPIRATLGARLDYARIVDLDTLRPVELLDAPALAALAVYFGTTRLIDNAQLAPPLQAGRG
jgi:pantoate--beta-alanine ligase